MFRYRRISKTTLNEEQSGTEDVVYTSCVNERDSEPVWPHAWPPPLPEVHTQKPGKRIAGLLGPRGKTGPALHALQMTCT